MDKKNYVQIWRCKFQEKFDEISGKNYLQFACEGWNPGGCQCENDTKTVLIVTEKITPYI